ncbi:unannotated protein [freshwater metagenome]|uniref:Unannotated protein n=1 Tax=freshwater metagenome TaxID=449393 RepID=A0A6J6S6B2_9ZZZZ|nr:MarR family transcriptional regulator [Actinomycetota bacterium]
MDSRENAPPSSTSLLVSLRQQEAEVLARLQPLLTEHQLLPEHWRILAVLDEHPGTSMTLLAATAVVPAASLTRHVDRLVERALVVRRIDPDDRRRTVLALSPRGSAVARALSSVEAGTGSTTSRDRAAGARPLT